MTILYFFHFIFQSEKIIFKVGTSIRRRCQMQVARVHPLKDHITAVSGTSCCHRYVPMLSHCSFSTFASHICASLSLSIGAAEIPGNVSPAYYYPRHPLLPALPIFKSLTRLVGGLRVKIRRQSSSRRTSRIMAPDSPMNWARLNTFTNGPVETP